MTVRYDRDEVKAAPSGRWPDLLISAGISRELLDGRHHPCPRCSGTDRFRLIDPAAGAVLCSKCFVRRNGDGLAAVRWMLGCTFPEALKFVAEFVGIAPKNGHANSQPTDLLEAICRIKRMPREAALEYAPRVKNCA